MGLLGFALDSFSCAAETYGQQGLLEEVAEAVHSLHLGSDGVGLLINILVGVPAIGGGGGAAGEAMGVQNAFVSMVASETYKAWRV